MRGRLERIAALEARMGADPSIPIPALNEAIKRCYGVLRDAFNGQHYWSIRDLGRRLRAGTETTEDLAILDAIPADALEVLKMDARGFVEMLAVMDEKI